MQTSYIYSASRMNTQTENLLTRMDIDRLLVTTPGDGLHTALKETYLAPYLLQSGENMAIAIEQHLIEAKKLIHRVSPKGDIFRVLWVQYDIHNLRVFAKAGVTGLSLEACARYLSKRGIYEPEYLYERISAGRLNGLQQGWQEAYDESLRLIAVGDLESVDGVFDQLFFTTVARMAEMQSDRFIKKYHKTLIDLHNLKSRLRTLSYPNMPANTNYVSGGNFALSEIETKEQVFALYQNLGGEAHWREAIETYTETKNTTQLDARADDFMLTMTREAGYDMFSSASLVLYYLRCRQSAANIRLITVGIDGGMTEKDIRPNLRLAYVN